MQIFRDHFNFRVWGVCAVFMFGAALPGVWHTDAFAQAARVGASVSGQPESFANLVEKVRPAVVSIQVDRQAQPAALQGNAPPLFAPPGFTRALPQANIARVSGSGFIISADGYVVTNNHVVESARRITVTLSDGRIMSAQVVGTDPATDVALLKLKDAQNLPTVALGDDHHLRVGDWVVAVGNSFGLGGTVTAGIVSSIGRDIGNGPYTDYLQIDAPINQGNSGGPTFDTNGQVVGMNTAIYSPTGGSVGIGFAIPASTVRAIVDQLKQTGSVARGWLGVQVQDVTPELASSLGLKDTKGAIVADVVTNSPADRAGIRQGDIIVATNGVGVTNSRDLTRIVAEIKVGQRANIEIERDGLRRTLTAAIAKREDTQVR